MSNQFVIDGLKVKLAEIGTTIRATEQRLRSLAEDKATIARALRLFGVGDEARPESLDIPKGEFTRGVLDVLRTDGDGMSARQIAQGLAKRAGRTLDAHELDNLVQRVRAAIPRMSDRLEGELRDRTTFWRVK